MRYVNNADVKCSLMELNVVNGKGVYPVCGCSRACVLGHSASCRYLISCWERSSCINQCSHPPGPLGLWFCLFVFVHIFRLVSSRDQCWVGWRSPSLMAQPFYDLSHRGWGFQLSTSAKPHFRREWMTWESGLCYEVSVDVRYINEVRKQCRC